MCVSTNHNNYEINATNQKSYGLLEGLARFKPKWQSGRWGEVFELLGNGQRPQLPSLHLSCTTCACVSAVQVCIKARKILHVLGNLLLGCVTCVAYSFIVLLNCTKVQTGTEQYRTLYPTGVCCVLHLTVTAKLYVLFVHLSVRLYFTFALQLHSL